jgi:hypothetical protein
MQNTVYRWRNVIVTILIILIIALSYFIMCVFIKFRYGVTYTNHPFYNNITQVIVPFKEYGYVIFYPFAIADGKIFNSK